DGAERSITMAVRDLQALDEILGVNELARAELGVGRAGSHELTQLLFAHRPHGGDVERFARINQAVPQGNDLGTELRVASDWTELHKSLPLVGPSRPLGSEISGEGIERNSQAAGPSVGA